MGRKYETNFDSKHFIWQLEHSEVGYLIDRWLRIQDVILPTEHWASDFERRFFEYGDGASQRHIDSINRHLRDLGLPDVAFTETDLSDYVRATEKTERAGDRAKLRDKIEAMDALQRADFVARCLDEMRALKPAHHTYEEWRATYKPGASLRTIGENMISIPIELARRLLDHTSDPVLQTRLANIIASSKDTTRNVIGNHA